MGGLWATVGSYALVLYPFVEGVSGMERGLSEGQWVEYGALLRQVHATVLPPALTRKMRRDPLQPAGAVLVRTLDAHIGARTFDDPTADVLATFWRARHEDIHVLLDRAEGLGRRLARTSPPFVLCHADIHTGNLLLDAAGQVWIVDWDETILAPRERDLMFAVGGIIAGLVGPREEELFFEGYGGTTLDPYALAYYRYAWALGDVADYGEQVFLRPDLGAITRRAALDGFRSLFLPGNIISLAKEADAGTA